MIISSHLFSGLGWSALSQGVRILLQFASIPILSRLLSPSDFGIYAMCIPVLGLAGLLQDFGLQQALVQKESLSETQLNNVFWINFLISVALAAAMYGLSGPISQFFREERLASVIEAFAVIILLGALGFGQYALLNRELRFRVIALIDMTCAILSFIVVISCAFYFRSFWALWAGALSSVTCWIFLSYAGSSWRPGFPKFWVGLDGLFRFGFHIMVHNFAIYFTRNLDSILIGKFLGSTALGFYDRAYKILLFPIESLGQPISRVVIPFLSRLRGHPTQFRDMFLVVNGLLHLACIPVSVALISCSEHFVLFLLGEKFREVTPIFFWLGFAGFVQPALIASHWVLIAGGQSQLLMKMGIASSVIISIAILTGLKWGVVGVAAAYSLAEVCFRAPFMVFLAGRGGLIKHNVFLRNLFPLGISACLTISLAYFLKYHISGVQIIFVILVFSYLSALLCLALFPNGRLFLAEMCRFKSILNAKRVGDEV